jgi:sigma-54 specific flagellar transcriptional regulator A
MNLCSLNNRQFNPVLNHCCLCIEKVNELKQAIKERVEDIPLLIKELSSRLKKNKRATVTLTPDAVNILMQHTWPGNVRELANLIERVAIIKPNGLVDVADLPAKFREFRITVVSA